jgi:hypothetical protein
MHLEREKRPFFQFMHGMATYRLKIMTIRGFPRQIRYQDFIVPSATQASKISRALSANS